MPDGAVVLQVLRWTPDPGPDSLTELDRYLWNSELPQGRSQVTLGGQPAHFSDGGELLGWFLVPPAYPRHYYEIATSVFSPAHGPVVGQLHAVLDTVEYTGLPPTTWPAGAPEGWQVATDGERPIRIAVPPDFEVLDDFPDIAAQLRTDPPVFAIEIHAANAPGVLPPPPWTLDVVADWLTERIGSWSNPDGVKRLSARTVLLPAGEAIEVRANVAALGLPLIQVVDYAVPTGDSIADLHFVALPEM
jgi:hypothetical protein